MKNNYRIIIMALILMSAFGFLNMAYAKGCNDGFGCSSTSSPSPSQPKYCYKGSFPSVGLNICISAGDLKVGTSNTIIVIQNGLIIDEFEATVIKAETNYDWDGGGTCINLGYPQSNLSLVSSQIDYVLAFQQQSICGRKVYGQIRPIN